MGGMAGPVLGCTVGVVRVPGGMLFFKNRNMAITNTFCLLPQPPGRPDVRDESSASRLRQAGEAVPTIAGIGPLKALLRSHLPDKGDLSICNHRPDGGGTEGSYIVQIQGEYVGWSTLLGFPCENDYHLVQLFQG